jgi:hypothetical protein
MQRSNYSGIQFGVIPEDARLVEWYAALALQVGRHTLVLRHALMQRHHARRLLRGAPGRFGESVEQAFYQLKQ